MYQRTTKIIPQKNDASRKRMFDRRHYKHIGWCICDDLEVDIDTETLDGVKVLLTHCMLMPHMEYDRKLLCSVMLYKKVISKHCLAVLVSTFGVSGG